MPSGVISLHGIQAEKLREARKARGYSVTELGKLLGVSRQAIDKYEKGMMSPSIEILNRYIDLLEFPLPYFQHPIPQDTSIQTAILYRSLSTSTATAREKVAVRADWMKLVSSYLNQYFDFPKVTIKKQVQLIRHSNEEIESIAENLRTEWGLGMSPIDNLTILLQNQGTFIARTDVHVEKSDACSRWVGNRPYAFLTADKKAAVRSRFDLAHELGHLVLHHVPDDGRLTKEMIKELDKEANRFAGAFLLPRATFGRQIFSTSLDHFIGLKKRWKVSIAAMVYRCQDLGILSENQTSYLWRQLAAEKMRTHEPLDDVIPPEKPTLFHDAIDLLIKENVVAPTQILEQIMLPAKDLSQLCDIPIEILDTTIKPIRPRLQLVKK